MLRNISVQTIIATSALLEPVRITNPNMAPENNTVIILKAICLFSFFSISHKHKNAEYDDAKKRAFILGFK